MTQNDAPAPRSPGVFLAVPAVVPQSSVATALRLLGFDPGTCRSLSLTVNTRGEGEVQARVQYVDRRDGIARGAVALVIVPVEPASSETTREALARL